MHLKPLIPFLMENRQSERAHERVLRILDQIGIKVSDQRLIKRLQGKRGVRFAGHRVTFDHSLVESMVNLPERIKQPAGIESALESATPAKMSILTAYHARHIVDADTGVIRPLTEADAIDMAKLTDALQNRDVVGGAPGAPQDIPANLRIIAQYKISLEWSRSGHYAPVSSAAEYRYMREMARCVGSDFGMECYLISPLRFEGDEVTAVLDYLETCGPQDKPVPVAAVSMPTMGLSGPVDPLALFVQSMAENIGGYVLLRVAFENDVITDINRPNAYPCDFRTGGFLVGSPEATLIEIIRRDMDRFYRCGSWARALRTMSPVIGIQTAAEKAAGAMAAALSGYGAWFGGGLIGLDEIFSPIQLMIDCEIRDYALQVAQGFECDEGIDDVTVLRDIINSEDALPFMTHPATLSTFRSFFREPKLFCREPYKGTPQPKETLFETARQEIKERIRTHVYRIDADKRKALDAIYKRSQQELG